VRESPYMSSPPLSCSKSVYLISERCKARHQSHHSQFPPCLHVEVRHWRRPRSQDHGVPRQGPGVPVQNPGVLVQGQDVVFGVRACGAGVCRPL